MTESERGGQQHLIVQLQDAHAMECSSLRTLELLLTSQTSGRLRQELLQHRDETADHARQVQARLHAHDETPSPAKDLRTLGSALAIGIAGLMRGVDPSSRLRDAYLAEHVEIAAYDLLGDAARRAGDLETVRVAERICAQEIAMTVHLQHAITAHLSERAPQHPPVSAARAEGPAAPADV